MSIFLNMLFFGLVLLSPLLFVVGIVLIVRGDRSKFDRGRCPCGYSLQALPAESSRCPECGLNFRSRRSFWRRCDRRVNIGIACLITAFLLPAVPFVLPVVSLLLER